MDFSVGGLSSDSWVYRWKYIPILRPMESGSDYYNRKGYHSILIQAVVEFCDLFIDVNIGWPGKVQDFPVFANWSCYRKGTNGTIFPNWPRTIGGVSVPLTGHTR